MIWHTGPEDTYNDLEEYYFGDRLSSEYIIFYNNYVTTIGQR